MKNVDLSFLFLHLDKYMVCLASCVMSLQAFSQTCHDISPRYQNVKQYVVGHGCTKTVHSIHLRYSYQLANQIKCALTQENQTAPSPTFLRLDNLLLRDETERSYPILFFQDLYTAHMTQLTSMTFHQPS